MRPVSFRCSWNIHRFDETDEFNRVWCSRCGARQPKRFAQIQAPELQGRQLTRPRTKGEKL
jgi:hypothetical protein